jgi:hypothetical protein
MEEKIIECKKILSKARAGSVICLSDLAGDIMQEVIDNYYLPKLNSIDLSILTLEDCFFLYHHNHRACECDADNERIYFVEE